MKFGSFKVLIFQFGTFCLSFLSIWIHLNVKYDLPLQTYYCDSSTLLPLQDGQSCFIDRRTSQLSNLWPCWFFLLCNVSFCQQVLPRWAGPMFWWMAKNLMTNHTYDAKAACLHNSAVSIESPQRRMSRIIPSNWPLTVYIFEAHQASKMIYRVRSLKWRIKTRSFVDEIISMSNVVFKDFECDMQVGIRQLGNPTRKTAESNDTAKQTVCFRKLNLLLQVKKSDL